jgi:hypothetical protein
VGGVSGDGEQGFRDFDPIRDEPGFKELAN